MFATLYYSLGIFINIDENRNFADAYPGKFGDRLRAVAVWLDEKIVTRWGRPGTAPSDS